MEPPLETPPLEAPSLRTPIRLLALDLDGTTLGPDRLPVPRSAELIRAAAEAGVQIALASGRMESSIGLIGEMIGVTAARVSLNGALVLDDAEHELQGARVPPKTGAAIIDYALRERVHVSMYDREGVLFAFDSEWGRRYAARVVGARPRIGNPEELKEGAYYKLLLADDAERIPEHARNILPLLNPDDVDLTESEPEYLEFMPKGTDKSTGLARVASHYGISREATAAVGDYLNDLAMLKWAGFSGAVANGHPMTRAAAHVVVGTNVEGGVAQFIERYVLQR